MNVLPNAITAMAAENRVTVRVPEWDYSETPESPAARIEMPDAWFIRSSDGCPKPLSTGYPMYLSRAGYAVHREELISVLCAASVTIHRDGRANLTRQQAAELLDAEAKKYHARAERRAAALLKRLRAQVRFLEGLTV